PTVGTPAAPRRLSAANSPRLLPGPKRKTMARTAKPLVHLRFDYQGSGPDSLKNPPLGPSSAMSANCTAARAPCSTVRVPRNLLSSVAVNPGHTALTLMVVPSSSLARATVNPLRALFDGA